MRCWPPSFVDAIAAPPDPDARNEALHASLGGARFVLRRDCRGALRRIDVALPTDCGVRWSERLQAIGRWREIEGGGLAVAEIDGLGRLYLRPDRLHVMLRLRPNPEQVLGLLERCAGSLEEAER